MNTEDQKRRRFLKIAATVPLALATLRLSATDLQQRESAAGGSADLKQLITLTLNANLFEPSISQDLEPDQWSNDYHFGQGRTYRARLNSTFEDTPFGPLYELQITDTAGELLALNRFSDGASVTFMALGLHAHMHIQNGFMSTTMQRWTEEKRTKQQTSTAGGDRRR